MLGQFCSTPGAISAATWNEPERLDPIMALQVGDRSGHDGFTALFGEGGMGRFYQQLVNRGFQSISSRICDLVVTETHSVLPERNIFNA